MINEATIEKRLVKRAKENDFLVRKVCFINRRGCPDRLIITPNGTLFWVELKTSRGRLSHAQKHEISLLRKYHQRIEVLSSVEEVDAFLDLLARLY
ncbi:VRR-NUC domain-containing protein [Candidatus Liberibacter solanacearum]|uniref:VRR-NUC domain-containing protein n=1 Tax=Candidatus Liberibacter solanacearum TaxID=556287 RepID=A0A424FKR4_9HYPH|nr:VRR-NUC domain-containing protein [Candidatus Liberibacter solanacearum]RPD36746.1 VRR-NUC domain-containing protein [Candidatus Liberibacter solanacearum]RPD37807.1 VRR-NUC domain-containing protein [Candidatus Liberibacter solanacearum]